MKATPIKPGLWKLSLGFVNAFLLDSGDGLTLIDTGVADSAPRIAEAIRSIGKDVRDVRRIAVTHCHSDHAGSLAAMKRLTGAPAIMHAEDASMVREGQAIRPLHPAPGLLNAFVHRFLVGKAPTTIEPTEIEELVVDGDVLPGGLRVLHVPGHCLGQIAILWPESRGVLIAADAAANALRLAPSPLYEDFQEGLRSLSKLAALDFDCACFGHGKPILSGAADRFRETWSPTPTNPDHHAGTPSRKADR